MRESMKTYYKEALRSGKHHFTDMLNCKTCPCQCSVYSNRSDSFPEFSVQHTILWRTLCQYDIEQVQHALAYVARCVTSRATSTYGRLFHRHSHATLI